MCLRKPLLSFIATFDWVKYAEKTGTYRPLTAIRDPIFTFIPAIFSYRSEKKFLLHPMVGICIDSSLWYPPSKSPKVQATYPAVSGEGVTTKTW